MPQPNTPLGFPRPAATDRLADAYDHISDLADAVDAYLGRNPVQRVLAAAGAGVWTRPANLKGVWVEVQGGGGGGGGAAATAAGQVSPGGGGNGGNYSRAWIPVSALGATENYTVGAGGVGVAGATGNDGGATNFGAHLLASGGRGGAAAAAGISGAVSSLGGVNAANSGTAANPNHVSGSWGEHGVRVSGSLGWAGAGGASMFAGSMPGPTAPTDVGQPGFSGGGGGSGARNTDASVARAGGTGGVGRLVIEEVFN